MRWIFLSEWSRHPSDWFLNACRPMRTMRVYQGVFRTLLHYACIPRRDIYSSTTMYVWGNLPPVAQWRDQCSAFHKEPLCCWIVLGRYYSSWNANTSTLLNVWPNCEDPWYTLVYYPVELCHPRRQPPLFSLFLSLFLSSTNFWQFYKMQNF